MQPIATDVAHGMVCLCVLVTWMCHAKTAELKCHVGGWLCWTKGTMY